MVRECLRALVVIFVIAGGAGCSLILDFSESAIPIDAPFDGPFSQAECDFNEPNDTAAAAVAVLTTEVGPAAVCDVGAGEDHDFYKFTVPAATASLAITITFLSSSTGDLDLRLLDSTGSTVHGSSVGFGNMEQITCPGTSPPCALGATPPVPPADYIFEVYPAVQGAVNRYDIAITLTPQ